MFELLPARKDSIQTFQIQTRLPLTTQLFNKTSNWVKRIHEVSKLGQRDTWNAIVEISIVVDSQWFLEHIHLNIFQTKEGWVDRIININLGQWQTFFSCPASSTLPPPYWAQTYSVCTPGSELDSRILNCSRGNNCDYNFVIKTCQMMKPIQIPPPLLSCAPPPVTQPQFHSTSAANSPPFENNKYDFCSVRLS